MDTMGYDIEGDEDFLDGDDDIDGEDELEGLDVVGAAAKRRVAIARALMGRNMVRRAGRRPLHLPKALQGASPQGISRPKEELDFLPFSITTAIPAGVLPAGFATSLEAFPQRPFRGERLIIVAQRTNAGVTVDVSSSIVISPAMFVGAVQVGASQGDVPLSTFSPTAFGVRLAWPAAGQGSRVLIPIITRFAQVAGDTTIVTATAIGRAVR
jgi:hypothetical protein